LILREAVFHRHVLALDIARVFQALTVKSCGSSPSALVPRKPTTGIADRRARAVNDHAAEAAIP
jgi:hypothetical protein